MRRRRPGILLIVVGLTILAAVAGFQWFAAQQANEGPCTSTGSQPAPPGAPMAPSPDRATMRWCYEMPVTEWGAIMNPPLVADGLVIADIPARGRGVHALDAATVVVRWKAHGNLSRLRRHREAVIALNFKYDEVVAFELATGRERWRTPVPGAALAWDLIVLDHLVYVTSLRPDREDAPEMGPTALDGATGQVRWRQSLPGGRVWLEPAGTVLLVAADEGTILHDRAVLVVAFDASSGTERWRSETRSDSSSPIVVDGGLVILAESGPILRALEASTGAQRWEVEPSGPAQPAYVHLTTANGTLYVEYQMVDRGDAQLVAIDPATGETRWVYHGSEGSIALELVSGDIVVYHDGRAIGALDAASCALLWRLEPEFQFLQGYNYRDVAVVGDALYATATDGFLYALELAAGDERWRIGIGGGMNDRGPDGVLGSTDTVYVWFNAWLYAFAAG